MNLTDSMPVVRRTEAIPGAFALMQCQMLRDTYLQGAKDWLIRNAPVVPAAHGKWANSKPAGRRTGDLMRHHADAPKAESAAYGVWRVMSRCPHPRR